MSSTENVFLDILLYSTEKVIIQLPRPNVYWNFEVCTDEYGVFHAGNNWGKFGMLFQITFTLTKKM